VGPLLVKKFFVPEYIAPPPQGSYPSAAEHIAARRGRGGRPNHDGMTDVSELSGSSCRRQPVCQWRCQCRGAETSRGDTRDSRYVNVLSALTAQSVQAVHLLIIRLRVRAPRGLPAPDSGGSAVHRLQQPGRTVQADPGSWRRADPLRHPPPAQLDADHLIGHRQR
jgi:hypothetical protein